MITLSVGNSFSQIQGLTASQHSQLKKLMSYSLDDQAAYFSGSYNTMRSLLGKRGDFPSGLLYIVKKWLIDSKLKPQVNDTRVMPSKGCKKLFNLSLDITPYKEQKDAATSCLERYRGIVTASTGTGKSVMIAMAINYIQLPTLVVVPSLYLKYQLTKSLTESFGKQAVGDLKAKKPIIVENVDALPMTKLEGYDVVILDEFHRSAAKTYRDLNKKAWPGIYYRLGFTATPFRSNDNERLLLESILSKVIYRLEYKTAVNNGYIVPMEAYYIEIPKTNTNGYSWQEVYKDLVVNNDTRNSIIGNMLTNLKNEGKSTLCLVKEIKHGEILSEYAEVPFANGQDGNSEDLIRRFSSGEIKALIGTTGVLGEGIDTKPAEYILIAGLGKSKPAFMQQVGRGFRKYPGKESCKVVIFKDPSHRWCESHFKAQVKTLKEEYGLKPVKIDIC